jgi:hypothetical protein
METIHGKLIIRAFFYNASGNKSGTNPIIYKSYFVTRDEAQQEYDAFKLANDLKEGQITAYWIPTPEALD